MDKEKPTIEKSILDKDDIERILSRISAEILEKNPTMKVEIQGHTDNVGSEAFNQRLSENRANAVKEYLISKGISADRLKAVGYGQSNPIAPNDTEEGRAMNRRVGMKVLER